MYRKGVETGHIKMAKESGKGSNSYKIGDAAKVREGVKTPNFCGHVREPRSPFWMTLLKIGCFSQIFGV